MRICTLLVSYEGIDTPFKELDPSPDPSLWAPEHAWETCFIDSATVGPTLLELSRRGFDAFVNLCDGSAEEACAGVEVVHELDRLGQAYTGADAAFYEPTRQAMKRACLALGLDTPRHVFARTREEAWPAAEELRFPLFVKHPNGYASVGLTPASRVTTADELLVQIDRMLREHGGVLIEEFIAGREITVLVAEPGEGERRPRVYPPLEVLFPPGESFKHFDLKWHAYEGLGARVVDDAGLVEQLANVAARIFEGLGGVGYARCDIRMAHDGRLYLIDVNPNPGVFYPPGAPGAADLILGHSPGGHRAFIEHIVAAALRRRDRRRAAL